MWPDGRAQSTEHRCFRHEIFELISTREPAVWELWPNENDREKALKTGCEGNIRSNHPFMIAWDAAFRAAFPDAHPPRARLGMASFCHGDWNLFVNIRGSQRATRPNGWWTTELDALAA